MIENNHQKFLLRLIALKRIPESGLVNVLTSHDDGCPLLLQDGPCRCKPTIAVGDKKYLWKDWMKSNEEDE